MLHESGSSLPQSFLAPVAGGFEPGGDSYPVIDTLEEFRAHLRPGQGIRAFGQGPITVVRYTVQMPDVFQTRHDLEARGLVFDTRSGELLSRPFHKFFNLGERQGLNDLDLASGWCVMDKLDGSMISAFEQDGDIVFATKGGVSDHAKVARSDASDAAISLASEAIHEGLTPIFEWTSPENRVIIAYPEAALTLLALRDRRTGTYRPDLAHDLATRHGVPQAEEIAEPIDGLEMFQGVYAELVQRTDIEGAVLLGPKGHRVKVKTARYLHRHKILANLANERYAYQAWIDGVVDDVAACLGGRRAEAMLEFEAAIEARIEEISGDLEGAVGSIDASDRRAAAAEIKRRYEGATQALAFAALGGADLRGRILDLASKRVAQPEKRDLLKAELGLPSWDVDLQSLR